MESAMELVFEKAVDEPAFSVAYAQMCHNLAQREINDGDEKVIETDINIDTDRHFGLYRRCSLIRETLQKLISNSSFVTKIIEQRNTFNKIFASKTTIFRIC